MMSEINYIEHFERVLIKEGFRYSEVKSTKRSTSTHDDDLILAVTSITRTIVYQANEDRRRIIERSFREDNKIVYKTTESDLNEDERHQFWHEWHQVHTCALGGIGEMTP